MISELSNEAICQKVINTNPNMLIPWYLMTSYLYYHKDISLISDSLYDEICSRMLYLWPTLMHYHKELIDPDALKAGTGYYIAEDKYPNRIKDSAMRLYREGKPYEPST